MKIKNMIIVGLLCFLLGAFIIPQRTVSVLTEDQDISIGSSLAELPVLKNYEAHRVSSYDKTGKNSDYLQIEKGETAILAEIKGPGCISHIWVTIAAETLYSAKIVLRMYWDGEKEPSVEAPIGDFFGVGHGLDRVYWSLPFSVSSNGRARNCWFQMPFESARITVTNEGNQPIRAFYYYIDYKLYTRLDSRLGRFHAQYRQIKPNQGVQQAWESNGQYDPVVNLDGKDNYVIMETKGRGHYIGCNLSIKNNIPGWWGEGDDMIYVDDAEMPTMTGTGSEDYFCEGWGMREFNSPYHGCPLEQGYKIGDRATVFRLHLEDPIPFRTALKVTIESGHGNTRPDNFSSVGYWYQTEPHAPFPPFPTVEERLK